MTENEAIKLGKALYENITNNANNIIPTKEYIEFIGMAIQTLEEIQQYSAIGTVEEIRTAMKYVSLVKKHGTVGKAIDSCAEYESIGTVEEFNALKEKSVAKKPSFEGDGYYNGQLVYDTWICPCCDKRYEVDYEEYEHCPSCGQKIDWGD